MSLLIAILIGVAVGGSAAWLVARDLDFLFINSLLGVAGSIVGLVVYSFGFSADGFSALFSWGSALTSLIGALVFVLIFDTVHKVKPKEVAHEGTNTEENTVEDLERKR